MAHGYLHKPTGRLGRQESAITHVKQTSAILEYVYEAILKAATRDAPHSQVSGVIERTMDSMGVKVMPKKEELSKTAMVDQATGTDDFCNH